MKDSAAHSAGLRLRVATGADVEALVGVINVAFRVELPFLDGERVNRERVREFMRTGKFLLAEDAGELAGCVYMAVRKDRGYVGLLSVIPQRQGSGLGRKLMDAAENYFREAGCAGVDLRVISQRTPLPAFYRHLGYVETGTAPFAAGVPAKVPGHYILMSKSLD